MGLRRFILAFFLCLALPVHPANSQFQTPVEAGEHAAVEVISSGVEGIVLEMSSPVFTERIVEVGDRIYRELDVPGASDHVTISQRRLPALTATLGVPPGVNLTLDLVVDEVEQPKEGVELFLHPIPGPPDLVLPVQERILQTDASNVDALALLPGLPVQMKEGWIRDQRIAVITFFPLQYSPSQQTVLLHKRLQVQLRFSHAPGMYSTTPVTTDESPAFEGLYRSTLLNYEQSRAWRATAPMNAGRLQALASTVEITGPRYKIVVDQDGIYRLTYADLQAAGMVVDEVDPRDFRMTSQGLEVAIYVSGESDGRFNPGDTITFYGQRFRGDTLAQRYASEGDDYIPYSRQLPDGTYTTWTPKFNATMLEKYTRENVYWLQEGQPGGARMGNMDGTPDSPSYSIPETYTATVRAEESNWWYSHNFSSEDTIFWDHINNTTQRAYSTTLTGLPDDMFSAVIRGEIVARTATALQNPDHHTKIWLNNGANLVDDAAWDGVSRYRFENQVVGAFLNEGQNQLLVSMINDLYPGQQSFSLYFDWYEIEFPRMFEAEADRIIFDHAENSGSWRYEISGFSSPSVQVFEINDPLNPRRVLTPTFVGNILRFEGEHTGIASYAAFEQNAILSPKSLTLYNPPDLKSPSIAVDYLIITHSDLFVAAQTLANHRSSQGLDVMVVDIADVYNEFNDGIFHSIAIKNLLSYAYASWLKAPSYVVLIGDGHWNFFSSTVVYPVPPQLIPPHLAWVDPWQGEVDSTNLLAAVAGDDILPDMYISRIPVSNAAELAVVVDKIIAYENGSLQDWKRHLLYIADNPDAAGNFETFTDQIIQDYHEPGFIDDRIFSEDLACGGSSSQPSCAPTINAQLTSSGASILTYIGHGYISNWGGKIFRASEIPTLTNSGKLPVLLSMTCLDGYTIHAGEQGMVESLLRADGKGIVGAFSPTGLGVATGHDSLHRGFYDSLFHNGNWELGQAALSGKLRLYATGADFDLIQTFTIYGDPAMRIQNPYGLPNITPAPSNKTANPGEVVTHTLQVTNSGLVSDTFGISIEGNLWAVDSPSIVGPVPPGESRNFNIQVTIPPSAHSTDSDSASLSVVSRGDTVKILTTLVNTFAGNGYDVSFIPAFSNAGGLANEYVEHRLEIVNDGIWADSYSLSINGQSWNPTWVFPVQVGPLAPGARRMVTVTVAIPHGEPNGSMDTATLRAASITQPAVWIDAPIRTFVGFISIYLPNLLR